MVKKLLKNYNLKHLEVSQTTGYVTNGVDPQDAASGQGPYGLSDYLGYTR